MIGLSVGEQRVELAVGQPVRVLALRAASVIRSTTLTTRMLQVGEVLPQQVDRRQRLERRHVAGAGHHHVGLAALVVARPLPDADARGAVADGRVHVEPLQLGLLAGHDHVDVVAAAQAVVGHRQQAVGVRRQVDPDDVGLLVDDVVDEARDPGGVKPLWSCRHTCEVSR